MPTVLHPEVTHSSVSTLDQFDLFADYEPDFQDDDIQLDVFDPTTQIKIHYGTENFTVNVNGKETVLDLVRCHSKSLGVSTLDQLAYKIGDNTIDPANFIPQPGDMVLLSAKADVKG